MKKAWAIIIAVILIVVIGLAATNNKGGNKAKKSGTKISAAQQERLKQARNINPQEEIKKLDRVIEHSPKNIGALLRRASFKERTKDFQGAINDYDAILRINPNFRIAKDKKERLLKRVNK